MLLVLLLLLLLLFLFQAASPEDSADGLLFMQEMVELSKAQASDGSSAVGFLGSLTRRITAYSRDF